MELNIFTSLTLYNNYRITNKNLRIYHLFIYQSIIKLELPIKLNLYFS